MYCIVGIFDIAQFYDCNVLLVFILGNMQPRVIEHMKNTANGGIYFGNFIINPPITKIKIGQFFPAIQYCQIKGTYMQ